MKVTKEWQGAPRPASLEVESRQATGGGREGRRRDLRNKGERQNQMLRLQLERKRRRMSMWLGFGE